jgi:hypothetical protein
MRGSCKRDHQVAYDASYLAAAAQEGVDLITQLPLRKQGEPSPFLLKGDSGGFFSLS